MSGTPKNTLAVEFDAKKIDSIFAEVDQGHFPGAAVGIAIDGKPVYRKGFGLASMELPLVLSPTIRMRIGSTTKHFTALAYMLLCEDGKAGIDDPIGKHVPELHPVAQNVTMRQLMGHLSGLRDALDICWQFSGTPHVSTADLLSLYQDIDDTNAAPGTAWTYINGGWLIVSVAIERITGNPLEHVMRERVFRPVGMYDTLLRRFDSDFVPNSATLHMTTSNGGYEKSYLGVALAGEGGMVSTIDDMLLWLNHMDAPVIGTAATWEVMKAPMTLANGTSTGYGLGLITERYRGVEVLYHSGSVKGGGAQMLKVPAAGLDVAIMANRHDVIPARLANRILDACLPDLDLVMEPASRAIATGVFRSLSTGRVIQLFRGDGSSYLTEDAQQIVSIDGVDWPFENDDDGVLWPAEVVRFMKQSLTLLGDPERPSSILFSDFGNLDKLVALKQVQKADLGAIAGHYRSDTTHTEAIIRETDGRPRLKTVGRFGSMDFTLECLADGIWRAKPKWISPLGGILSFDSDGATFRFSSLRTYSLPFRRIP